MTLYVDMAKERDEISKFTDFLTMVNREKYE